MNSELLVREAMACFGLGDMEAFLSFLSPDIEWYVHSSAPLPFGGLYEGRQAVCQYFSDVADILQISGILWSSFLSAGQQTALYGMASHRCVTNGSMETAAFAHWYEVEDSRIVRVRQFFDTASIQRMLEGKPSLRPAARSAASTAEAIGQLASISQQVDADEVEDFTGVLRLYGPDAPPRSITLPELADRNIEWNSSGLGSLPSGGPFYGLEAFGRHIDLSRQLFGTYHMLVEGQIACGNTLALHGSLVLDTAAFPPEIRPTWFHALTLREGRIIRGIEVSDSQLLLQAILPGADAE